MHVNRPELENETGGNEEEPNEASQSAKGSGDPVVRERKVLEDERAPVLNARGVCPCVPLGTIVVATCKFVDARCTESVEL